MGTVYAALHEKLGREVAIKVLNAELGQHGDALVRFQREAELVTKLGHPNIVAVYDFGQCPNKAPYFVMEVVSGQTLRHRLEQGPLADDEIIAVFAPLLSAVAAAHSAGVVHRDLKPENVMLLPRTDGHGSMPLVKLLDFGVAKIRQDREPEPATGAQDQAAAKDALATATGALMGTPAYMSPEQIKSTGSIDGRADIYAIGVMLFESVTGDRPFVGDTLAALLGSHLFGQAAKPSVVSKRNKVPARHIDAGRLDTVILRTLAKLPEERYPDCLQLRDDLDVVWGRRGLWQEASVGQAVSTRPVKRSSLGPSRWRWLVPLGLGLALVAALTLRTRSPQGFSPSSAPGKALTVMQTAQRGSLVEKRALATAIESVGQRTLLPQLTELLRDENEPLRLLLPTVYALGQPGDEPLLSELTRRTSAAVGAQAIEAQAVRLRLGAQDAVPVLDAAAATETVTPEARLWAALALSQAGKAQTGALAKLRERLVRPGVQLSKGLRQQLVLELVRQGDAATEKQLREQAASRPVTEASIDALLQLSQSGKTDALLTLTGLLGSVSGDERSLVVLALARSGNATVLDELRKLLDQDAYRLRALSAVGHLGPSAKSVEGQLVPLLSSSDAAVRLHAAAALIAIAEKESHVRRD
jgi:serine/threonine protein kinase